MDTKKKFDYLPIRSPQDNASITSFNETDEDIEAEESVTKQTSDLPFTSKWQSDMFRIQRKAQSKMSFNEKEYLPSHAFIRMKWLVLPFWAVIAVIVIIISIFYTVGDLNPYEAFSSVIALNIIGGIVGMMMVYKFSTITEILNFMDLQNSWYEAGIDDLRKSREDVSNEAKLVHFIVNKLKKVSHEMDEQYHHYDELRKHVESICGDNEHLNEMVDHLNKTCKDLLEAIKRNERAHLMDIYYRICLRDNDNGLSRSEYKRFMAQLNATTRKEFDMQGGFDAMDKNHDGTVDPREFTSMLDSILQIEEEKEAEVLSTLQQLDYSGDVGIDFGMDTIEEHGERKRRFSKGTAGFDTYQLRGSKRGKGRGRGRGKNRGGRGKGDR